MKVTVCFDQVRVTVPCGDGAIPVRELISKAVHRYRRAVGKGSSHWVEVTSLKTISGGGILDPDDQLNDVVDDREQLIAEYEEQDRPSIQHNGGDGASASSTGTTSPDIFQTGNSAALPLSEISNATSILGFLQPCQNSTSSNNVITDVVVTSRDLALGSNLRVRRGSEPNLNLLGVLPLADKTQFGVGDTKPLIPRRESVRESDDPRSESSDDDNKMKVAVHGSLDRKKLSHSRFARDATRTSLGSRPEMYHWLEAQENAELRSAQMKAKERTGPVEGHDGKDLADSSQPDNDNCLVCLHNDGGPLGIHAVPAYDENGKDMGLLIQSIEQDRPVHKDGRIKPNDIIVEINGNSLQDVPFLRAQNIFRAAMDTKEIRLRIVKGDSGNASTSLQLKSRQKPPLQPPPLLPKPRSHAPIKPSPLTLSAPELKNQANIPTPAPRDISKRSESVSDSDRINETDKVPTALTKIKPEILLSSKISSSSSIGNVIKPGPPIKAPKKVPPALPARNPSTSLTAHMSDASLNAITNTRRIGKKLTIQLKKGPLGLGFSVTSRDNQTDGNCPIYIRNILPKGAAVQNGQLRPGDRLLEVNGVEMTGKTQAEAVNFLRMLPEGSIVELVLSRQEEVDEKFKVPRKMGNDAVPENKGGCDVNGADDGVSQHAVSPLQPSHCVSEVDVAAPGSSMERITLHIPLNETGSAGLGVSVKGKTESSDKGSVRDLGIFVKTVLQGGAAYKDGRLQVNDKLLEVNGVKLEGMSNTAAMEALRLAMMEDSQTPGIITLTVSRRANSEHRSLFAGDSSDNSQVDMVPSIAHKRASSASDVATINHQRSSSASEALGSSHQRFGSDIDMPSPIPPVRSTRVAALRERFSESGLRNESYTKATHESFNEPNTFTNIMPNLFSVKKPQKESLSKNERNIWIVENDTYTLPNKTPRPHSTIGFIHGQRNSQSSASDDEAFQHISVSSSKDESDQSPHGDLILPFAREGFGRQSMSEKRKGHLDPRQTETYKLVKANKENKGSNDALALVGTPVALDQPQEVNQKVQPDGPSINSMVHVSSDCTYQPRPVLANPPADLKRASSLENLINITGTKAGGSSSISQPSHEISPAWRPSRFGRARTCNDSFRAAVDRSYDALDPALMDTLEEESAESGAFTFEPSHSSRSSVSSDATNEDTNSLKRRKAKEKEKKGLFKGFLRFGKGRKSDEEAMRRSRSEERSEDRVYDHKGEYSLEHPVRDQWAAQPYGDAQKKGFIAIKDESQQQRGRRTSQQEQERIEEEYARLRDHHVGAQRLRSQSVDPSAGRSTVLSSPSEGTSPFRLYKSTSSQQPHLTHQQNHIDRSDPRSLHPAAVAHGSQVTGHDFIGNNQTYSSSVMSDQDVKSNVTKAVMSRAEYIQQLRSLYQQRHRQRQGVYPLDDREEQYERHMQEVEGRNFDLVSPEHDVHMRDPNMLQFYERPSSRQTDQYPPDNYTSFLNTNNSTAFHSGSYHPLYQQQQWHEAVEQSLRGSLPQSRGGPVGYETSLSYHHQPPQGNISNQFLQHRQHVYPQQVHEDLTLTHFQDQYSRNDGNGAPVTYHTYEHRPQQFYTGPSHAYRPTPDQYSHHRGNAYVDSSSTKV